LKYELGSPEWLAVLHGMIVEGAARERLSKPNLRASSCEVLLSAPDHLADADGKVTWSLVIQGGNVDSARRNATTWPSR
jgi:hypothetical protein